MAVLLALSCAAPSMATDIAAVDRWTVQTDRAETHDLTVLVGETKIFQTVWANRYRAHDFSNANEVVCMYRPYSYAGTNWHYSISGAVLGSNVTEVTWRPNHDSGDRKYRYQIEVRGNDETLPTARGILRVIGEFDSSTSASTSPVPREIIDFSQTEVRNPGDSPFAIMDDFQAAAGISATDTQRWTEAYGWGDHGQAGYATGTPVYAIQATSIAEVVVGGYTGIIASATQPGDDVSDLVNDVGYLTAEADAAALEKIGWHTNLTGNAHGLSGADLSGLGALTNEASAFLASDGRAASAERIQIDSTNWITLVGGTGVLYRVETGTNLIANTNYVVFTEMSVDYNGSFTTGKTFTVYTIDPGFIHWDDFETPASYVIYSHAYTNWVHHDTVLDAMWAVEDAALTLPQTLTIPTGGAVGTITIDWLYEYEQVTNAYPLALLADLAGDNLGDHTATQPFFLGTNRFYLGADTNAPWMQGLGTTNILFGAGTNRALFGSPW